MDKNNELCKLLSIKHEVYYELKYSGDKITEQAYREGYWSNDLTKIFVYPNLTLPSNFIKLLKIKYGNEKYETFGNFFGQHIDFEEDMEAIAINGFIEHINHLINTQSRHLECLKLIQNKAQKTEWVYNA